MKINDLTFEGYYSIKIVQTDNLIPPKGDGWKKYPKPDEHTGAVIHFRKDPLGVKKFNEVRADVIRDLYQITASMRRSPDEDETAARKAIVNHFQKLIKNAYLYKVLGMVSVKIDFLDGGHDPPNEGNKDSLLTPGDKAHLKFKIESKSADLTFKNVEITAGLNKELKDGKVIKFKKFSKESDYQIQYNDITEIKPGAMKEFLVDIQMANENNNWVFKNLINLPGSPKRKPKKERSFPLEDAIRVVIKATIEKEPGDANPRTDVILYDEKVSVLSSDEKIQDLSYPDLYGITGVPPDSGGGALEYFRYGDPSWCHTGSHLIRKIAIRAARYRGSWDHPDKVLKDDDPFPDDAKTVVTNIANFINMSLNPKAWPGQPQKDTALAVKFSNGTLKPITRPPKDLGKIWFWETPPKVFYVCIEHAFLFGSLLRALGIPARETNILQHMYIQNWYCSGSTQDSASHVFYDKKWHFWSLYGEKPTTSLHKKYANNCRNFDIYTGIKAYPVEKVRFSMAKGELDTSPYWKYLGYGNKNGFYQAYGYQKKLRKGIVYIFEGAAYLLGGIKSGIGSLFSKLTLPDGKRIGSNGLAIPIDYDPFEANNKGVINDIPGAYYYPEGFKFYAYRGDPSSLQILKESIFVPVNNKEEYAGHRITLTGTANGDYKIHCLFIDEKGDTHTVGTVQGTISRGEQKEINGGQFKKEPDIASAILQKKGSTCFYADVYNKDAASVAITNP
jgi:hypothetical protein